jgi:prevent-host-death family protein
MSTKPARNTHAIQRSPRLTATHGAVGAIGSLAHVDASKAREQLSELLGRVAFGHEHIAVDKHGKPKAVMVPLDDYEHFRWLEDYLDGMEGLRALAEYKKSGKKSVSSDEVLKELGIE